MSEENAQKKNKFRPVVFGCLIPSAGFLVLAIIAALLLSRGTAGEKARIHQIRRTQNRTADQQC